MKKIWITGFILALTLTLAIPSEVFAATDEIFGSASPFEKWTKWILGNFAYFVSASAIVILGCMLAYGADFSAIGRRLPSTLLGVAIIMFASTLIQTVFSGTAGATFNSEEIIYYDDHFEVSSND
jgi:type IV secretory pathway VirB2 component (pilin)